MNEFIVNVSSAENPDDQTELNLLDYQNKNQFMAAAKKAIHDATGEDKPEMRFEYDDATVFDNTNLVSENNIDESVWEYFVLTDEDMAMTAAFATLYPDETGNVSELVDIAEERTLGNHGDINDFGYAFLDAKGFMDNLPRIIEDNIDIDAISEGLMMTHKTLNGWYFANKEQDGWHLSGSND